MDKYRQLLTIFFLSLLIHISIVALWLVLKPEFVKITEQKTITVQIIQQSKPSEAQFETEIEETPPEVKEIPKPVEVIPDESLTLPNEYYAGDEMQSSNQEDKAVTELKQGVQSLTEKLKIAKQESSGVVITISEASSTAVSGEKKENKAAVDFRGQYNTLIGYDDHANESQGEAENALQSSIEQNEVDVIIESADSLGNYQWLNDQQLDAAFVKDPFSEKKSKEFKLINIYFKQITDVIFSNWINPLSPSEIKSGASVRIRLQLNDQGFLDEPSLYLQSRFPKLDKSLIQAVRSSMNHQFNIPDSYLKKYSHLTLSWSSDGSEYELMPFEQDTNQEN